MNLSHKDTDISVQPLLLPPKALGILILKSALMTLVIGSFLTLLSMVVPNTSVSLLSDTSYLKSVGFLFMIITVISLPFITCGSILAFFVYKKLGFMTSFFMRAVIVVILSILTSQILHGLFVYVRGLNTNDASFYPVAFISALYGVIFALSALYQEWVYNKKQVSAS